MKTLDKDFKDRKIPSKFDDSLVKPLAIFFGMVGLLLWNLYEAGII